MIFPNKFKSLLQEKLKDQAQENASQWMIKSAKS